MQYKRLNMRLKQLNINFFFELLILMSKQLIFHLMVPIEDGIQEIEHVSKTV